MCDIWKNHDQDIISVNDINNIFTEKVIPKDTDITITWWEPLLHKDIKAIIKQINDLGYSVNTISTNWILLKKIEDLLTFLEENSIEIPQFHISIDGLEKTHEFQRGTPGSFKKSINTIKELSQKWIRVKMKYTITKDNIRDIIPCKKLAEKLWVDITFKIVENDENYTNRSANPNLLSAKEKLLILKILNHLYPEKDTYIENLLFYIEKSILPFECKTPHTNMFIMANGDVYPCTKYESIWNIKENSLADIYRNTIHTNIVKYVEKHKCSKCFSPHWSYKSLQNELHTKY